MKNFTFVTLLVILTIAFGKWHSFITDRFGGPSEKEQIKQWADEIEGWDDEEAREARKEV